VNEAQDYEVMGDDLMTHHHHHDAHGHHHDHGTGHGHSHGIVDPSITTTTEGLWALKWSFVVLMVSALLQVAVVAVSGSVALLADTIHNFGDAATAIPLGFAFLFARTSSGENDINCTCNWTCVRGR
jgi:Co/Zn/Cd efflux system component